MGVDFSIECGTLYISDTQTVTQRNVATLRECMNNCAARSDCTAVNHDAEQQVCSIITTSSFTAGPSGSINAAKVTSRSSTTTSSMSMTESTSTSASITSTSSTTAPAPTSCESFGGTYTSGGVLLTTRCGFQYTISEGSDFSVAGRTLTFVQCMDACAASSRCKTITFLKSKGQCVLNPFVGTSQGYDNPLYDGAFVADRISSTVRMAACEVKQC